VTHVPIVPSAILYDLDIGAPEVRPDAAMGRAACEAAVDGPIEQGCVGAGTGARVGSMFGPSFRMKGGIGTASVDLGGGVIVGALAAVNCYGDVVDPESGQIIAGARKPPSGNSFANTLDTLRTFVGKTVSRFAMGNTVIGVVATNAKLNKEQANRLAQMAHNGLARAIRPAHTLLDGDTIFALATGKKRANSNVVGAYAPEVMARAIVNGVRNAKTLGECIAAQDFTRQKEENQDGA
jgi:L-aminopeptidase/D-esterase-like protein